MIKSDASLAKRPLLKREIAADLVVVGGGLAGTCCAITAARAGLKAVLLQDRPVLGGNASSEVRLWVLGATSHMGNNNRWAREGGVIDEILVENMYRNPEGNPIVFDALLLELVSSEPNITLLLNTSVYDLEKSSPDVIARVQAFCSQNSTLYEVSAPFFCDASGDGIVGFLAGAAFRMGAESREELGEKFAPAVASNELLGHTIYFYSKDTGRPVKFVPPGFALREIEKIPRWRDIRAVDYGCRFWWLEWGGRLDTIHDSESIKWELWKVVYGVWDYIKNSGRFPEAETMTLEWVGSIPGKRESRRFEGDYILRQQDIIEQRQHADAVSFGGWAIDLHPQDGVYSELPGCQQWHSKGVYQVPYRSLYSRNISNLFLAGRIISASHVAFGSTRVMGTCASAAQAVALAAALCLRHQVRPALLLDTGKMAELQRDLLKAGQFIPNSVLNDPEDIIRRARLVASSTLELDGLRGNGQTLKLENSCAMMLPLQPGAVPEISFTVDAARETSLEAELRVSSKPGNHTPDVTLSRVTVKLERGESQPLKLKFDEQIDHACYAFVCLLANDTVSVQLSDQRVTGILSLNQKFNRAVAKSPKQQPPPDSGMEEFEFWLPQRRPEGKNLAMRIDPPLRVFGVENLANGIARPTHQPNAWVAALDDRAPVVSLSWEEPQRVARVELMFDTDYDHPMESALMGHPERVMPFCVQDFSIHALPGQVGASDMIEVARISGNHQTRRVLRLDPAITTRRLDIRMTAPDPNIPAALFEVRCYSH
jgi:hypothetical protein